MNVFLFFVVKSLRRYSHVRLEHVNAPVTAKLSLFDRIKRLQQTQDHFSRERCISERNIRTKTSAKYVCCDV